MQKRIAISLLSFFILFSCSDKNTENNAEQGVSADTVAAVQIKKVRKISDSAEANSLRMVVSIKGDSVFFRYRNTGDKRFCLWTHTEGYGLTWNAVEFKIDEVRSLMIDFDPGMREKSGRPESKWLNPNDVYETKWNLQELITEALQNKQIKNVGSGEYLVDVIYDSAKGPLDKVSGEDMKTEHWSGKLKVEGLSFSLVSAASENSAEKKADAAKH